jgi:hypothetical protein
VDVALKNISSEKLNVGAWCCNPDAVGYYKIRVLDSKGAPVPFTKEGDPKANPWLWRGKLIGVSLKPGESLNKNDRLFISKWWDLSKPGEYTVLVEGFDLASRQTVKAQPVIVTVTE